MIILQGIKLIGIYKEQFEDQNSLTNYLNVSKNNDPS